LLWDHSIGTAIIARILAKDAGPQVGELTFVGGLLHNVGKAIMNNECSQEYTEIMKSVYNEGRDSLDLEKEVFKYAYPEVGCRVIEKWGLPENIVRIVRYHRLSHLEKKEQDFLKQNDELRLALGCVELAYEICRKLGFGFKSPQEVNLTELAAIDFLKLDPTRLDQILEEASSAYLTEKSVFTEV